MNEGKERLACLEKLIKLDGVIDVSKYRDEVDSIRKKTELELATHTSIIRVSRDFWGLPSNAWGVGGNGEWTTNDLDCGGNTYYIDQYGEMFCPEGVAPPDKAFIVCRENRRFVVVGRRSGPNGCFIDYTEEVGIMNAKRSYGDDFTTWLNSSCDRYEEDKQNNCTSTRCRFSFWSIFS